MRNASFKHTSLFLEKKHRFIYPEKQEGILAFKFKIVFRNVFNKLFNPLSIKFSDFKPLYRENLADKY